MTCIARPLVCSPGPCGTFESAVEEARSHVRRLAAGSTCSAAIGTCEGLRYVYVAAGRLETFGETQRFFDGGGTLIAIRTRGDAITPDACDGWSYSGIVVRCERRELLEDLCLSR